MGRERHEYAQKLPWRTRRHFKLFASGHSDEEGTSQSLRLSNIGLGATIDKQYDPSTADARLRWNAKKELGIAHDQMFLTRKAPMK